MAGKKGVRTNKYLIIIIAMLLFLCFLQNCKTISRSAPPTPEQQLDTGPEANFEQDPSGRELVLEVNGLKVSRREFYDRFKTYLQQNPAIKDTDTAWREFIDELTNQLLIISYAEQANVDKEASFQQELKKAKEDMLVQYVLEKEVEPEIAITNQEIVRYYYGHIDQFTFPPRIQVRHILTATYEEAEQALRRLKNGEEFAKVAQDMSLHYSRADGGLLPYFSPGTYNKEFEKTAFSLKVGQLSHIIRTELGYHIMEKTGEMPERVRPLSEVRDEIYQILHAEKREELKKAFIERLREKAKVKIHTLD